MRLRLLAALLLAIGADIVGAAAGPPPTVEATLPTFRAFEGAGIPPETGFASYYVTRGRALVTANGEPFHDRRLTAAHRTLPFGTKVRVTNIENGQSVVVRINDRGPFIRKRVIDVTERAARQLQFLDTGLARVRLEIVSG